MFPFIPLAIASLAGGAYLKVRNDKRGIMTPERQQIYDAALTNLKDPIKLRSLADGFEKEGFRAQANLLRKRAVLRELSPEERDRRKEIFNKTMQSTNTKVMEQIAGILDEQGATGAAASIRLRINTIENQAIMAPQEETPAEEVKEEAKPEETVEAKADEPKSEVVNQEIETSPKADEKLEEVSPASETVEEVIETPASEEENNG